MKTTVSIVMPTLNQGRFIEESVRSVMSQGVRGLELVVMDGGSTDGTLSRLAALAGEFPGRIRWASRPDSGPAQAIARALAAVRSPIVGWLNSDDLYAPGAVQRALDHFASEPADVMVYGEARHIDALGRDLGRYPTRPPVLTDFVDGCFICQPSVFFRRDAVAEVGGIDQTLKTAFDFELWLRLFKFFPGRIGYMAQHQACSRLHEDAITSKMREAVALEALRVIRQHIGPPPVHWILTHILELCERHPFESDVVDLHASVLAAAEKASPLLDADADAVMRQRLANDRQLQLASPHVYVSVWPDGWAGDVLEVRLRQPASPYRSITLVGSHLAPGAGLLRLEITGPEGLVQIMTIDTPGSFEITIDCSDLGVGARTIYRIWTPDFFVPADWQEGSEDRRRLAYQVEHCETRT